MSSSNSALGRVLASSGAGLLYAFATPVFGQTYLLWLWILPLFWLATRPGEKRAGLLVHGFLAAFVFTQIVFFWVTPAFTMLWGNSFWVNWFFAAVLMLLNELPLVLTPVILNLCSTNRGLWYAFPAALALADYGYPKMLGHTFAHWLAFHPGPLSNFRFPHSALVLNLLLLYGSIVLFALLMRRRFWYVLAVLAIFTSLIYLLPPKSDTAERSLTITTVNTALGAQFFQDDALAVSRYESVIKELSELPSYDVHRLVVLPEIIYPYVLSAPDSLQTAANVRLLKLLYEKNISLIMGGMWRSSSGMANVMYFVRADGATPKVEWIGKQLLFPFGEALPFADSLPILREWFPGPYLEVLPMHRPYFEFAGVKIGIAICYEGIFPRFTRERLSMVDLVLNPTTEAFFPPPGEPSMAAALTVFSSLENNVPMVRVTNAGSYGYFDRGSVVDFDHINEQTVVKEYRIGLRGVK